MSDPVTVVEHADESALHVTMADYKCIVVFTSVLIRDGKTGATTAERPSDALPLEPCLRALAELRHAKWYQVRHRLVHAKVMWLLF